MTTTSDSRKRQEHWPVLMLWATAILSGIAFWETWFLVDPLCYFGASIAMATACRLSFTSVKKTGWRKALKLVFDFALCIGIIAFILLPLQIESSKMVIYSVEERVAHIPFVVAATLAPVLLRFWFGWQLIQTGVELQPVRTDRPARRIRLWVLGVLASAASIAIVVVHVRSGMSSYDAPIVTTLAFLFLYLFSFALVVGGLIQLTLTQSTGLTNRVLTSILSVAAVGAAIALLKSGIGGNFYLEDALFFLLVLTQPFLYLRSIGYQIIGYSAEEFRTYGRQETNSRNTAMHPLDR